jgi:hypothetical protein
MTTTRKARGVALQFCVGLLLSHCAAVSAQNEEPGFRNVVLLSDTRADTPDWQSMSDILVRDGYKVSIVPEPRISVEDEVAATKRVIAEQDGQCILVAHRYAGPILTEAATDPSVAALVFVVGHVPEVGPKEVAALVEQAASNRREVVAAPHRGNGAAKNV